MHSEAHSKVKKEQRCKLKFDKCSATSKILSEFSTPALLILFENPLLVVPYYPMSGVGGQAAQPVP